MAEILQPSDGIIDFDILIKGQKIKDTIEVIELQIEMEVNKITSATLVVQDGGAIGVVNRPFSNSEGHDFLPGNEVEIRLGYIDNNEKVFKGIIVSQRLTVKNDKSQLTILCKDKAVGMTKGRFNAIFQNKKDSDALNSIAAKYSVDFEMDATQEEHPVLMQYNCTDWDYTVIRAEANDMLVTTYQNKVSIKNPPLSEAPKFEINASQFVMDITLSLESEDLASSYKMSAWDPLNQAVIDSEVKLSDPLSQGNFLAKKLADVISNPEEKYSSAPLDKQELELWGKSAANRAILSKIKGKIRVPGTTKLVAGDVVMLSEFSQRFNGKAFISKVIHQLKEGDWYTELTIGKNTESHAMLKDVEDMGASGLFPALRGTQVATVKKIEEDPDHSYRVLVTLPALPGVGQEEGIWARLAFPYASNEAGFFFFPEVGDEVILTFMNNDPRFPVIFGSLYSAKNKPKEIPDEINQFKSIYTKSGLNISFDDEDKIVRIETPEKQSIVISDKDKSIALTDMNSNSIVMDESGITMKSPKDITIKADGDINIEATSNLALKATADATLDGSSITQSAQTSFTAKGNASAELSASGQTTVKGAMVMIN